MKIKTNAFPEEYKLPLLVPLLALTPRQEKDHGTGTRLNLPLWVTPKGSSTYLSNFLQLQACARSDRSAFEAGKFSTHIFIF